MGESGRSEWERLDEEYHRLYIDNKQRLRIATLLNMEQGGNHGSRMVTHAIISLHTKELHKYKQKQVSITRGGINEKAYSILDSSHYGSCGCW